mmetsp:Transcript_19573/g.62772  ORF Transcript_19573/g.62772 Transcript_19573/m.62772 type:complete len:228 (-) Transcript_19573:235-918(-)
MLRGWARRLLQHSPRRLSALCLGDEVAAGDDAGEIFFAVQVVLAHEALRRGATGRVCRRLLGRARLTHARCADGALLEASNWRAACRVRLSLKRGTGHGEAHAGLDARVHEVLPGGCRRRSLLLHRHLAVRHLAAAAATSRALHRLGALLDGARDLLKVLGHVAGEGAARAEARVEPLVDELGRHLLRVPFAGGKLVVVLLGQVCVVQARERRRLEPVLLRPHAGLR